ncbi:MAG: hypothetical protein R8M45_03700 [Ghiorsea sp.]
MNSDYNKNMTTFRMNEFVDIITGFADAFQEKEAADMLKTTFGVNVLVIATKHGFEIINIGDDQNE